jgi:hypothetical protein
MRPVEDLHDVSLGGASPVGCLDSDDDGKWSVGKRRWNPSHRHRDQGRSSCIGECEERKDARGGRHDNDGRLGCAPPLPWSHEAMLVPEEDTSTMTVLGGDGGWGRSADSPFSGGTDVEGLVENPGPGGAIEEGSGVHSMGE